MNLKKVLFFIIILLISNDIVQAQFEPVFRNEGDTVFTLSNGKFARKLLYSAQQHAFYSTSFRLYRPSWSSRTWDPLAKPPYSDGNSGDGFDYPDSEEFSFQVNGKLTGGGPQYGHYDFKDVQVQTGKEESQLIVTLLGRNQTPAQGLEVNLYYAWYYASTGTRKWLSIKNLNNEPVQIENIFWEKLNMEYGCACNALIYKDYGRVEKRPSYIGNEQDPAIAVYYESVKQGFIVGNEAPSFLKETQIYDYRPTIAIGMRNKYPYVPKVRLGNREIYTSPKGFILHYYDLPAEEAYETVLNKFIRKHLDLKIFTQKRSSNFIYNTWNPFFSNINDQLIREVADELQDVGVEILSLDDGWQSNYGDWEIHPKRFPNGIKPVCDYIRSKGMKPGIWLSPFTVHPHSKAYEKYKEYVVLNKAGQPEDLHWYGKGRRFTMSPDSPYFDYILEKISKLIQENGIEYIKLDFATVKSAYVLHPERNGDYRQRKYGGHSESYLKNFQALIRLGDDLNRRFPTLLIDFTYEIWGYWHAIDYALLQHAHVDWVSNFFDFGPKGPREVRSLAYDMGLTIPTSAMLIGNQQLNDPNYPLMFHSLLAANPLVLGDPRQLSEASKAWFKSWWKWYKALDNKYQITHYYQTSGFRRPQANDWDGFARFNPDLQGGFIAFFRNNSPEEKRRFTWNWLKDGEIYYFIEPISQELVYQASGQELKKNGLLVHIPHKNASQVLAITTQKP